MNFRNIKISVLVIILVIQCSMQVNAAEISKSIETNKLIQQKVSDLPVDTEEPVLEKIELDKSTYQAGETVKVSITATDDVSGVKMVSAYIKSPDGAELGGTGYYDSESGKWIVNIPLSNHASQGKWQVSTVGIYDQAGHFGYYRNGRDYTQEFNVENKLPVDTEEPVLEKIELDKSTYQAGETVKVSITATDDVSGVKMVSAYIKSPDGAELGGTGYYDSESGKWIVNIPLSNHASQGKWQVSTVGIYDQVGHFGYYRNGSDYTQEFNVENKLPVDTEEPVLEKIELDKSTYQAGETVKVSITATDDVSGVKMVSAYIKSPDGAELGGTGYYDSESGKWIVNIPLSNHASQGKWQVSTVGIYDQAGHFGYYRNGRDYTQEFDVGNIKEKVQKVEVTPDKVAPQEAGVPIQLKVTSEGSKEPQYRFFIRDEKDNLTTLQKYGSADTATWTPTKPGTYRIIIHAKDKNSDMDFDSRTEVSYKIGTGKVTSVNVTPDKVAPQEAGVPIQLKVTSEGSKEPQYRFYIRDEKDNLITLQKYGSADTATWTPTKSGTYRIIIHAKDKNSSMDFDSRTEVSYKIGAGKVTSVNVTPDKVAPQAAGVPIQLKVTSEGSKEPQYRFYIRDEKDNLITLQKYGSADTATWTPTNPGTYRIIIHAKDKNSSMDFDSRTEVTYKVAGKITSVNVTPDKVAPQAAGAPIQLKVTSEGSKEPQYRFYIRDEKDNLITLQKYGSADTATWTPTKSGTYRIIIHAKDKNSSMDFDSRTEISYKIEAGKVTSVNVTPDKVAPQAVGVPIQLKATSKGSEEPEYRFLIRDEKDNLTTLQEYDKNETVKWIPTKPGTYRIIVHAKDKSKPGLNLYYESRTEMTYKVQ